MECFCLLVIALLLLLVGYIVNTFALRTWNFFIDRGVNFDRGIPLFGTLWQSVMGRESVVTDVTNLYNRFPNDKYIGLYQMGGRATYLIRDLDLIKAITVKDFDSFVNHGIQISVDLDPLMGRSLFNLNDEKWRELRSILSPLFTGSKMRMMLGLMGETIEEFVSDVRSEVLAAGDKGVEFNLKDIFTCITNDSIASCAFGMKVNSFKDRSNRFYETGHRILASFQTAKFFLINSFPTLCDWFRIKLIDEKDNQFFRDIVHHNVAERKKHNIVRHDMIHLLTLLREGKLDAIAEADEHQHAGFATVSEILTSRTTEKLKSKSGSIKLTFDSPKFRLTNPTFFAISDWTDEDLVAQCMVFFTAGFSGVAVSLCFLCHELAVNPDIQQKLYDEIAAISESNNDDKITYEVLQKMKYLDMVISEGLRKWAIAFFIDRVVNKQYLLENSDGSKVILEPGQAVWMPVYSIQRDPKHYPNPDKFDPERFSAENKGQINPTSYMPFGAGPRGCIASRFALMQLKATIFYLLRTFHFECGPSTQVPLRLKPLSGALDAEKGFFLQFRLRH